MQTNPVSSRGVREREEVGREVLESSAKRLKPVNKSREWLTRGTESIRAKRALVRAFVASYWTGVSGIRVPVRQVEFHERISKPETSALIRSAFGRQRVAVAHESDWIDRLPADSLNSVAEGAVWAEFLTVGDKQKSPALALAEHQAQHLKRVAVGCSRMEKFLYRQSITVRRQYVPSGSANPSEAQPGSADALSQPQAPAVPADASSEESDNESEGMMHTSKGVCRLSFSDWQAMAFEPLTEGERFPPAFDTQARVRWEESATRFTEDLKAAKPYLAEAAAWMDPGLIGAALLHTHELSVSSHTKPSRKGIDLSKREAELVAAIREFTRTNEERKGMVATLKAAVASPASPAPAALHLDPVIAEYPVQVWRAFIRQRPSVFAQLRALFFRHYTEGERRTTLLQAARQLCESDDPGYAIEPKDLESLRDPLNRTLLVEAMLSDQEPAAVFREAQEIMAESEMD